MPNKINFTRAALNALAPAATGKRAYFNDTKIPGLQIQVTANGVKTFYVYRRVNGRPKRIKLGRYPDMTPAQARNQARQAIGEIAAGGDPVERKRRERADLVTLQDAFDEFLRVRSLKPKTVYDYRNVVNQAFGDWQRKQLCALNKDLVAKRHERLGKERGEAYANLAMRVLRAIYNFAAARYEDDEGNSLLPPNPVKRISATRAWFKQRRRDHFITEAELPAWFAAVLAHKANAENATAVTVADYLLLLIFTGLRRNEAATLSWPNVDLANNTLTIHDTKNHERHTLPLPDYLLEILKARHNCSKTEWVFPSERKSADRERTYTHLVEPRKHIAQIIEASSVPFTLHDLRRTFVTYAERLDISSYAVKRLINHKMRGDVTAGYIGIDIERLKAPMQQICNFLLSAAEIKPSAEIVRVPRLTQRQDS